MTEGEKVPARSEEEHEEFYDALSDEDFEVLYPSKEDLREDESIAALLDSIFGSSPPEHLLRYELKFQRPPAPQKNYKPSRVFPFVDRLITSAQTLEQYNQVTDAAERMDAVGLKAGKPLFFRIGGMLTLPMPASGPLFSDDEAEKFNYTRRLRPTGGAAVHRLKWTQ